MRSIMAYRDFKPIYTSQYTAQGTLVNDNFPRYIDMAVITIGQLELEEPDAVGQMVTWLRTFTPPLAKFIKNYEDKPADEKHPLEPGMKTRLAECKRQYIHWKRKQQAKGFPYELADKLYGLYSEWWTAFNNSGAGLRSEVHDPQRDSKLYAESVGKTNNRPNPPFPA